MARTPPDIKAAALAGLLAGEQPAVVAERYGLDPALVRKWKERHVTQDVTLSPANVAHHPTVEAQKATLGELIIGLLRAKLEASQALASAVSDPKWIKRQSAAELAALGQWLDTSAFAIGDRLANGAAPADE